MSKAKLFYFQSYVIQIVIYSYVEKEFPPHKVKITPHITDSLITTKWLVYNSSVLPPFSSFGELLHYTLHNACSIQLMIPEIWRENQANTR